MRSLRSLVVLAMLWPLALSMPMAARAQSALSAPYVAGCPAPVPDQKTHTGWPAGSCKYQFYPLTDTVHAVASVSKTAPIYAHTYSGYPPTAYLIACPQGAVLSADQTQCTANGKDASGIVSKALVGAFSIAVTPPAAPQDSWVSLNWSCSITNKVATCTAPVPD